ncbi:hypothetical protein ARMSODRAFT_967322 [Armillaria solidipes]|uniref:Uncharacterized protein n=1 Tax=Armillaria solidipes TaxID=1076256 RepID=A0A2H3AJ10_9AGAR|nr:hypothetical protein ARMSODRAFT_967322 [Armillaria solidipes]
MNVCVTVLQFCMISTVSYSQTSAHIHSSLLQTTMLPEGISNEVPIVHITDQNASISGNRRFTLLRINRLRRRDAAGVREYASKILGELQPQVDVHF